MHHQGSQPIGHEVWETPIANITSGMAVVRSFYMGYDEKVDQTKIFESGNDYLREHFPRLDYIKRCWRVREARSALAKSIHADLRRKDAEVLQDFIFNYLLFPTLFVATMWILLLPFCKRLRRRKRAERVIL